MTFLLIVFFSVVGVLVGASLSAPILAALTTLLAWVKTWSTKK